jgi:cell shape-determining protein MreC
MKKTYAEILKGERNPFHDKSGAFTSKSKATPASGLSSVPKIIDALEISPAKMAEYKKQGEQFRKEREAREAKLTPEQRKRLERERNE